LDIGEGYRLLEAHHADLVEARNRFGPVNFDGQDWDLSHLKPFAFKQEVKLTGGIKKELDVIVLFSCHCFTAAARPGDEVDPKHWYDDGHETRVLNSARYELSGRLLPKMIHDLPGREIRTTGGDQGNYMTLEIEGPDGELKPYIAFFDVERDKRRKGRVILRVQSAYVREDLGNRLKSGEKVNFHVLVRAAYEGKKIR